MKNEIKEFFDLRKFELEKFIEDLRFKVTYFAKNDTLFVTLYYLLYITKYTFSIKYSIKIKNLF